MRTVVSSLIVLLWSASVFAQPPRADATLRVTVVDPSGAVIVGASVRDRATRRSRPARAATPSFDALQPGRYAIHVESPGFEPADVRDVRVRAGENRREVKLAIAKLAETVQVGRDARERASDPRSDAFATVLGQQQIDELPDDPDEMEQALRDMAGPGRGAARERVPRRPAAAEKPDSADPVPPQHVRRRHARARVRLGRHHHEAGPRQLARVDQHRLPRRGAERAQRVRAGQGRRAARALRRSV